MASISEEYMRYLEEDEKDTPNEYIFRKENNSEDFAQKQLKKFRGDGDPRKCKTCD